MSGFVGGGGDVNTSAPRIASVQFQTSAYGGAIPIVFGMTRVTPNLIDYDNFAAISHTEHSGGGKGGGPSISNTTYTYTAAVIMALCEGPIVGISRVWADKSETTILKLGLTVFLGDYTQNAFGFWQTYHPTKAIAYRGQAYVATGSYDLGSNASLPNHSFEVIGLIPFVSATNDAVPADVATILIVNKEFGLDYQGGVGDWTQWRNYCIATGIFISPAYVTQKPAHEILSSLARLSNTALFNSEGVLKAVPYGDEVVTGNGATYIPNITPVYDLTLDDFLAEDGEAPVKITRSTNADAYNQVQVQFFNRAKQYNNDIADRKDAANIELFGLRAMQPIEMHEICESSVASNVAQLILQRTLYTRNQFEFRLGWKYCLLEPMDLVTLTEPNLGLDQLPVRIIKVAEDAYGTITITAEDYFGGIASAPIYPNQESSGYAANYQTPPGDANPPLIFEPPENLTQSGMEAWLLASGGADWGGCQVWVSSDDQSYTYYGDITAKARQGVLASTLPSGGDPDGTNTLAIDMSMSGMQVLSGSQVDADQFNTLCYVGGELISYRDSSLTSANHYSLNYLRRGVYLTPISSHASGSAFCRIDNGAFLRLPFDVTRVGAVMYIKLVSYNIWGGGLQDIAAVPKYTYTITGAALNSPPHDVANLHTNYVSNLTKLYCDRVTDFRSIDYELRTGPTWATATVLGRSATPVFTLPGNGTYWVAARATGSNGSSIYSLTPQSVVVSGATLVKNVVATIDEAATWSGTVSGGAVISAGNLQLNYTGDVASIVDLGDPVEVPDLGAYGSVQPSGSYLFDASHNVTLAASASCNVQISYDVTAFVTGVGITDAGPDVDVIPQISLNDGTSWGAWQNYEPGVYTFVAIKARINLVSRNPLVSPQVSALTMIVDVPDLIQSGHITTSAGGTVHYTFAPAFNGGADPTGGGLGLPSVQITIEGSAAGDDVRITNKTTTGFDVDVINAGVRVVRALNVTAQGY